MKTILLPTDFSTNARNALHFATKLYEAQDDVQFVLLHSYLLGAKNVENDMDRELDRAIEKYNIKCLTVVENGSLFQLFRNI